MLSDRAKGGNGYGGCQAAGMAAHGRIMDYALYIATFLGAVALLMMLPRQGASLAKVGAVLGAATLGGLWLFLARQLPDALGISRAAMIYYYVFSALGLGAAVRVITHTKPVYSALWFVMVVLASSGLLLVLGAEFMAFALIIIYGGAILVTYVFVIMLAAQAQDPQNPTQGQSLEHDRIAREPVAAIAAGFLLLAVVLSVAFSPLAANARMRGPSDEDLGRQMLPNRASARVLERAGDPTAQAQAAQVRGADRIDNAQRIGVDLFTGHYLGLELAGVILLVSLVGAVVIARQRVAVEGPGPAQTGGVQTSREAGPTDAESTQAAGGGRTN